MLIAVLLLSTALCLHGATLRVGAGQTYANLQPAAQAAAPGDTILVFDGLYAGGQYVANLRGRADAWITIMAAPGASPVWQGGVQAWHLVEAAFVRVVGITFEGQSGNGVILKKSLSLAEE